MRELFDLAKSLAEVSRAGAEAGEGHIRMAVQSWIVDNFDDLTRAQIASLQHAVGIEPQLDSTAGGGL